MNETDEENKQAELKSSKYEEGNEWGEKGKKRRALLRSSFSVIHSKGRWNGAMMTAKELSHYKHALNLDI